MGPALRRVTPVLSTLSVTRRLAPFAPETTLGVTEAQARAIAYCIAWHVPEDRHCPDLTPALQCLKDADSLDRLRFGATAFDPAYLRLDALRGDAITDQAEDLAQRTLYARGPAAWG